MSKPAKKQYYVVINGRQPGIYRKWYGADGAQEQVEGIDQAIYKGFVTEAEAWEWLSSFSEETLMHYAPDLLDLLDERRTASEGATEVAPEDDSLAEGKVVIATDGGAIGNPGPGGFGVVLRYKGHKRELSGSYRLTTNNRMELMACISGLEALRRPSKVVLYSDSRYVVDSMTKGSARRWKAAGWRRSGTHMAENCDLWDKLIRLCDLHEVDFRWIRGHAGHPDNERCDQLATEAVGASDPLADEAYEARGTAGIPCQPAASHLPGVSEASASYDVPASTSSPFDNPLPAK